MISIEQLKLLKNLYQYKLLGYQYYNDIQNSISCEKSTNNLPSTLEELKSFVLECHLCQLAKTRKNVVFGEGNLHAKLMFVGEGPGMHEDERARPFVGRAGELLTRIIENVLLIKREDVYIANIVKCRPPNNRVPTYEEATTCLPFLQKQIQIIQPKIIVTLGATSYRYLTNDLEASITKIRGEIIDFGVYKLIPTFHPSYLLRNPSAKKYVYADMLKVKAML